MAPKTSSKSVAEPKSKRATKVKASAAQDAVSENAAVEVQSGDNDAKSGRPKRTIKKTAKVQEDQDDQSTGEREKGAPDRSDVPLPSAKDNPASFSELREHVCKYWGAQPGRSQKVTEERIEQASGLSLIEAVDESRQNRAAKGGPSSSKGQNPRREKATTKTPAEQPKPPEKPSGKGNKVKSTPATMTAKDKVEYDRLCAIRNNPKGLSEKALREERNMFGGLTNVQLEDYHKARTTLSERRKEEQARIRLADIKRKGRLVASLKEDNDPEQVPEEYRTTRSTLGGWEYSSPRAEAMAHRLLGGNEDYGLEDNLTPSVEDVLLLRINFAKYRPDLPDPTAKIDIIWRQWDTEGFRLKEGAIFTRPVENPGLSFVPLGPGKWLFNDVYVKKPSWSAAEVWRMRQQARAQGIRDVTQHLEIAWWPAAPGVYSRPTSEERELEEPRAEDETDEEDEGDQGEGGTEGSSDDDDQSDHSPDSVSEARGKRKTTTQSSPAVSRKKRKV